MNDTGNDVVISATKYLAAIVAWWATLLSLVMLRFEETTNTPTGGAVYVSGGIAVAFAIAYVLLAWLPRTRRADLLDRLDPSVRTTVRVYFVVGMFALGGAVVGCGEVFGGIERADAVRNLADRLLTSSSKLKYAYVGCATCTNIDPLGAALLRVTQEVPTVQVRWVTAKGADLREVLALVNADPAHVSCRQVTLHPEHALDTIRGTAIAYEDAPPRATVIKTEGAEYYQKLVQLEDEKAIAERHAFFRNLYDHGSPCEEAQSP